MRFSVRVSPITTKPARVRTFIPSRISLVSIAPYGDRFGSCLMGYRKPSRGNSVATDYPSPQSGRASLRMDNQRPRRWDPRPSKWGRPAQDSKATHQVDHSATNAAKPIRRSIGARDRVLDASHRSNHWALDDSPDEHHPIFGLHQEPDPRLASWAIPEDRQALLSARVG